MKKMNCVSTMPEIMPEITDEAIIEALFAQRPYEEKGHQQCLSRNPCGISAQAEHPQCRKRCRRSSPN